MPSQRAAVSRIFQPVLKRSFDAAVAAAGLIALAPLLLAIAFIVRMDSPGPAIFRQDRVGRGGRIFRITKFRTMFAGRPNAGSQITVRDDMRVTRVGAYLRRHKLDELPQLLNVLFGEMSFVGPRPEVPRFMSLYSTEQLRIISSLKPGITDYASLLFRDESSMLDGEIDPEQVYVQRIMPIKYQHYKRYMEEMSFLLDVRIILATIALLLTDRLIFIKGPGSEIRGLMGSRHEHLSAHAE